MSTLILNFTFHGIGDPPAAVSDAERDVWLSQADFSAALGAIRRLPDRSTVSFDDGNASDLAIALPALLERCMKGTFFVVADRLDKPGYLGADDLHALREAGMTIGLHGMHHQRWRGLSDGELDEEIAGAAGLLEDAAGASLEAAACPFGAYDRRVLGRLEDAGFRTVFTSDGGWASSGAWLQARNTLRAGDGAAAVATIAADAGAAARAKHGLKTMIKRWR
ncbi:MAG TPA: polysaccharide deacetylase family protein [Solirubrobacterales bacterium]|jgi:peptidoglycan/xylan/chitin deacetylase (PgdA/CDA1 family)